MTLTLLTAGLVVFAVSCSEPSPFYGRWADNKGDSISFFDDGSFIATIIYPEDKSKDIYEGSYTILLNALTLSATSSTTGDSMQIVSEWDIRGNMLYLDWATEAGSLSLTLYKISD
jgi:hypothetical protein